MFQKWGFTRIGNMNTEHTSSATVMHLYTFLRVMIPNQKKVIYVLVSLQVFTLKNAQYSPREGYPTYFCRYLSLRYEA